MAAYLPPGWPAGVHPPGSEGFEQTAVAWLLDALPADYRVHGVLRRHPIALAVLARHHLTACVAGARQGYRSVRTETCARRATVPIPNTAPSNQVTRREGQESSHAAG